MSRICFQCTIITTFITHAQTGSHQIGARDHVCLVDCDLLNPTDQMSGFGLFAAAAATAAADKLIISHVIRKWRASQWFYAQGAA